MKMRRRGAYGTMVAMDASQVTALRELLATTGWPERTRDFARAVRSSARAPGSLLLFGPPGDEPWHLAAHLDDESRLNALPELAPTLVRWKPPPGAPPHLRVGLDRLEAARRGEALLVVSAEQAPEGLLERVDEVPFLRLRGAASCAAKLREHGEQARLYRRLTRIALDAPVPDGVDALRRTGGDALAPEALCERLRFGPLTRTRLKTLLD